MSTGRIALCSLLVTLSLAVNYSSHSPYRSHYPPGYGYHADYFKPTCSATHQCYDYLIVLVIDAALDFSAGNATHFQEHYRKAGFDRAGLMAEGRRAAGFLQRRYGVDLSRVPDEAFLGQSLPVSRDVTFTFVTVSPTLYMAAKKDHVRFFNVPASAVWWNVVFSKEFTSTGTYRGTIPAGGRVYYGSFVGDTCPDQSDPSKQPSECILSRKPYGRKFFRFYSPHYEANYQPGPFVMLNSVLEDEEWGRGQSRGVLIQNEATGITTGHDILTFPDTCAAPGTCFAGHRFRGYG